MDPNITPAREKRATTSRFHYVAPSACLALAIDQSTKAWAARHLSTAHPSHLGPLVVHLTYNLGTYAHPTSHSLTYLLATRALTSALLVGMLFVFKSRPASVGIGLLFAGLLGNFLSLLVEHRVPDFLVLGHIGTANVADLCAALGLTVIACSQAMFVAHIFTKDQTKAGPQAPEFTQ